MEKIQFFGLGQYFLFFFFNMSCVAIVHLYLLGWKRVHHQDRVEACHDEYGGEDDWGGVWVLGGGQDRY